MQVFRNPNIVDTRKFDAADTVLVDAIRHAGTDAGSLAEAVRGKKATEIRAALGYLFSHDPSRAADFVSVATAFTHASIRKFIAEYVIDRPAMYLQSEVQQAQQFLRSNG